jgi:cholesterol oxidase
MGLFGGAIQGVSSVIANSVGLTPRVPRWSHLKLMVAPFMLERVLGVTYLNPSWSKDPTWTLGKVFSKVNSLIHRECDVPACHMLSLMWGTGWPALYAHDKLHEVTHRRGGDLYGGTAVNYYRHVLKMVRAGNRAVKYLDEPRYAALPDDYVSRAPEVTTPVLFVTGSLNHVFSDSNILCHQVMQDLAPGRHGLHVFPGYGHQDVFMGKDVASEVFPTFLTYLRRQRR